MNVAVTLSSLFIVKAQAGLVPLQALPVQPAKTEPASAVAVRATEVPWLRITLHLVPPLPQLMLPRALFTFPEPVPDSETERI